MGTLDAKCTLEQFNLLEIMLVGRAVTEVMKHLFPAGADPSGTKGTVVVATLEGDVHDLGKNILKMVLTGNGYRVVDCGKDCPLDRLLDTVERERPVAVAIERPHCHGSARGEAGETAPRGPGSRTCGGRRGRSGVEAILSRPVERRLCGGIGL